MGFLVLSRRLNEKIFLDDNIEIIIADIRRNNRGEAIVDIGIKAPKSVKILKEENYFRDKEQKTEK